jgi:hypothetical protein
LISRVAGLTPVIKITINYRIEFVTLQYIFLVSLSSPLNNGLIYAKRISLFLDTQHIAFTDVIQLAIGNNF